MACMVVAEVVSWNRGVNIDRGGRRAIVMMVVGSACAAQTHELAWLTHVRGET